MVKRKSVQRPDAGMRDFQNANCKKGCRFADEAKVGSGTPCCRFGFQLITDGETCYSRATPGPDPTFTCQACKRETKYSELKGSRTDKDLQYDMRVCSLMCARQIREGG